MVDLGMFSLPIDRRIKVLDRHDTSARLILIAHLSYHLSLLLWLFLLPFWCLALKCAGLMTMEPSSSPSDQSGGQLTFAVPKGRILDEALPLMARTGIVPEEGFHDKKNRSLSFDTNNKDMRLIRVRAFDVATFVAHGAAQIGIVGSDVIEEFNYDDLYAPVDLDIGHCRLSVARLADDTRDDANASHLRVATKYPSLTARHFEARGIQAECVKLNGAMELAPSLGLARQIVDLVSSGATLKQNGLVETQRIIDITARLIVNRAAYKTDQRVAALVDAFRKDAETRATATSLGDAA